MRIFIAGATGVVGRAFVRAAIGAGHEVIGLSRSDANDATLRRLGATPRRGDLFDAASLAAAGEACDVFVRAATFISTASKPTKADWAVNDRIRIDGTRAMLDAAQRAGAKRYVQESIAWLARPDDGAPFDETSPPRPVSVTASAAESERLAAAAPIETATVRFGWLYGPEGAQMRSFADMLRRRKLPVIGNGHAPLSFLHEQDAGSALLAAAVGRATGVFHAVDDKPTPVGAFFDALAAGVGGRRPMRVPRWVGRLAAGAYVTDFLTTPMVTGNARIRKELGWAPAHPDAIQGIRGTAASWQGGEL